MRRKSPLEHCKIIVPGKIHWWLLSGWKSEEKQDICSLKVSPLRLVTKGKIVTLPWETWETLPTKWSWLVSPAIRHWYYVPPKMRHWEEHITCVIFLAKMHKLSLIKRKHQANLNWEIDSQSNRLVFFKSVKVMKNKGRFRGVTDWKRLSRCDD